MEMICQFQFVNEKWLDDISRIPCEGDINAEAYTEATDQNFYGFRGLGNYQYLYRVLRNDEDVTEAINCKNPPSLRTVVQHIASGSKYGSRFISTTLDINVAALWAYYEMETVERKERCVPLRVVRIDIQILAGTWVENKCINLCNEIVRNHFIKGATHRSWAISSQEVLFEQTIPLYVMKLIEVHPSPVQLGVYVLYPSPFPINWYSCGLLVAITPEFVNLLKPTPPPPKQKKLKI